MTKKEDELEDRIDKIEINIAVKEGINKWVRTICVTATSVFLGFCTWLGNFIYAKYDAINAAVRLFLTYKDGQ